jgi:hypothetical protein
MELNMEDIGIVELSQIKLADDEVLHIKSNKHLSQHLANGVVNGFAKILNSNNVVLTHANVDVTLETIRKTFSLKTWHERHIKAKKKRESRLSYRFKKWFIGLRPVNNYLWYRKCTSVGMSWKLASEPCGSPIDQTLFLLPDYPSIRRLA